MRHKTYTQEQVKTKIKKILKIWKSEKRKGKIFPLTKVIGDYTYNSMNRYIKEVMFYGIYGSFHGRNGAQWYLRYPKQKPKKLAKLVMKSINVTYN